MPYLHELYELILFQMLCSICTLLKDIATINFSFLRINQPDQINGSKTLPFAHVGIPCNCLMWILVLMSSRSWVFVLRDEQHQQKQNTFINFISFKMS